MSCKNTIFQRQKKFIVDFSSEDISSDTSFVLLEKIERKHQMIKNISDVIPDNRDRNTINHTYNKMLTRIINTQF